VVTVGSNDQASFLSGVSINLIKLQVYALSGLMAAISGIILTSRLTSVQPLMGTSYELDAIAAAVIGGTSMSGGKGTLVGTVIGAIILAIISNGLDLLSINQFYRMIITGLIIVIAVGVEHFSSSKADAG
jgi:ribose transport system permease protein